MREGPFQTLPGRETRLSYDMAPEDPARAGTSADPLLTTRRPAPTTKLNSPLPGRRAQPPLPRPVSRCRDRALLQLLQRLRSADGPLRSVGSDRAAWRYQPVRVRVRQPSSLLRSLGLEVAIVGHLAAGLLGTFTHPDSYHLALSLNPDSKCECTGERPKTVGAQRERGRLVTKFDYPGDHPSRATFRQIVPTPAGHDRLRVHRSHHRRGSKIRTVPSVHGPSDQPNPRCERCSDTIRGVQQQLVRIGGPRRRRCDSSRAHPANRPWIQAPGYENPIHISPR